MPETSQPAPTSDADGALQPFAHVHADKQAVYRAILEVFSEAKQRFVVHLRPEDVAERLPAPGADLEAVTAALDQLVRWGNLRPYPDTSRVTTVEDFNRRRHVYALTPHGEAAETALAAYADALGRRGELQAVALSDIRVGLRTLERLALTPELDVAAVAASLRDLHTVFHNLAENATAFMATVQRSIDRSHMEVEEFLGYKERLIGYLQRFIGDLVVISPEIAALLVRLDDLDVDRLLYAVGQREAADAAPDGAAETTTNAAEERLATLRARWSGLRQWFVGGRDAPSQAALLRGRARAAIPALLDTVRALNERYAGRSDRAADFRALARWFAECDDDAEAHRLWRVAFGLSPSRHLSVDATTIEARRPEPVPPATPWAQAPAVKVSARLRATGFHARRGRLARVADRTVERAQLADMLAAEASQVDAARRRLATGRPTRLSELELDRREFALFLRLLGDALAAAGAPGETVRTVTSDGTMEVVLQPLGDGTTAQITTPDGVFRGPDHLLTVHDLTPGADTVAAMAARTPAAVP
jgi:uncharacterized protein (TIGR02677 family)